MNKKEINENKLKKNIKIENVYRKEELSEISYDDGTVGRSRVNVRTCLRCKRLYHYMGFGHSYCSLCKIKDDADFTKVKDYIYECGTATALEVSDYTGVSLNTIEIYLREGRLIIPENSPIFIKCEKCRADIRSGRLCIECASQLDAMMRREMDFDDFQIGEKPKEKRTEKMRYLTRDKNK